MKGMVAALTVLAGLAHGSADRAQQPSFDLVVSGGLVIDGTGAPGRVADVGVRDGRIAAVGDLSDATAADRIDARGLAVAPGFVDVHTHADNLAEYPEAGNFVRMGVTTIVAGNCGGSAVDVGEAFERIRAARPAV